ncbi:MAG: hypothetical protein SGARI_001246 [Bacillariaceae sp.]
MRGRLTVILLTVFTRVGGSLQPNDFFPLVPQDEVETDAVEGSDNQDSDVVENSNDEADSLSASVCDKDCMNSGVCVVDDEGKATCSCSPGYSGESCENEGEACGTDFCHHSSKCLQIELSSGASEHICDCTPSYTSETLYSGEFCQYPSTEFCTGPNDPNGRQFCVNNGKCPTESHHPCICPEGFSGPRCAFQMGIDGMDYRECDLDCRNGGTCHKGMKQQPQKHLELYLSEKEQERHEDYEHCVCPSGWYGIRCEYQVEECAEGEHLCFHGSTCIRDDEDEFSCDCMSANVKTAGLFCEYIASSECDEWKDKGNGHRGFCTNGGTCSLDPNG